MTSTDTKPRFTSRKYGRSGHGYLLDGEKVDGVTSILNALPKALTQWASDIAANYAVEHWDELTEATLTKRLDAIRYAHRDALSSAALRGQDIHAAGERLVHGEPFDAPEELQGPAEAYARFLDKHQIQPVATEALVGNATHRYGGRGDLWATLGSHDNARVYIDLKTGKNVYESVVLQAVAYDRAEIWQPDGPDSEQPYTPVDLVFVAHILPDDVRLLPVRGVGGAVKPGDAEFRTFLYVQQVAHWLERHGWKGDEPLIEEAYR